MDGLAVIVRAEKDAEYTPVLAAKDAAFAAQGEELSVVKAELEALKADFDAKIVNGAMVPRGF